jgi:hypothetical protein
MLPPERQQRWGATHAPPPVSVPLRSSVRVDAVDLVQRALLDVAAQRGVPELGGSIVTLLECPADERLEGLGVGVVHARGVGEDPRGAGDGVAVTTDAEDVEAQVVRHVAERVRSLRDRLRRRLDGVAVRVHDGRDRQPGLHGELEGEVADAARLLGDGLLHTLVLVTAEARRPLDLAAGADLVGPGLVLVLEPLREDRRGARAVGAVHDGQLLVGEVDALVQGGDRLVVDVGDLAAEDRGDRLGVEGDALETLDVVGHDDATEDHGDVQHLAAAARVDGRLDVLVAHEGVAAREVDLLRDVGLAPAAGADRVVVDGHARLHLLGELADPGLVDRVREARAGAGEVGGEPLATRAAGVAVGVGGVAGVGVGGVAALAGDRVGDVATAAGRGEHGERHQHDGQSAPVAHGLRPPGEQLGWVRRRQ